MNDEWRYFFVRNTVIIVWLCVLAAGVFVFFFNNYG